MGTIISATARSFPHLPFHAMQEAVLGDTYELSLTFIGTARARALNKRTRKKTYVPNVLSFPLSKKHGEIYITPQQARREAKRFDLTERGYIGYLFIHGLLHLKGIDHGTRMDQLEQRYMKQFKLR